MEGNKDTPHRFMEVTFKKWKEGVSHKSIKRGINRRVYWLLYSDFLWCWLCVAALVLNEAQYTIWGLAIIWGIAVSLALYLTAAISGAHINPAVTLSLAIYHKFSWAKVIPYMFAQIAGTFTGGLP
jgi:hypothetical protein